MEQKLLLEKKLTVALGLLATCQLDLTSCRGQAEGEKGWLETIMIVSAIRSASG